MQRARAWTLLLAVFGAAMVLAAVVARRTAPVEMIFDPRRSTLLSGPDGAQALAETLEELGIRVERRRRSLFGYAARRDSGAWLALLDVPLLPTGAEVREVVDYLGMGGGILLAGETGIESCLGFQVRRIPRREGGVAVVEPVGAGELPDAEYVWEARDPTKQQGSEGRASRACAAPAILSSSLLLHTEDGRAVAWRHELRGGGRVIMLADSRYVSNRTLKETEAGPVVLGWIVAEQPTRVVVDEYHHGFQQGGSLFRAAGRWLWTEPGGWVLIQLAFVGLLTLAAGAVRFGPALRVVERRRRSALEHLEALAVGMERAEGRDEAVALIVGGLRRRLRGTGHGARTARADVGPWLDSLALAAPSPEAGEAVTQLGRVLRERGGDERVLDAALAVEDVWEALRPAGSYRRS